MTDVLFLTSSAPPKSPFSTKEKRPPLGVGSMISILREEGHNVHFMDRYLDPTKDPVNYLLQYNNIEFVGIYSNTICSRDTIQMIHNLDALRKSGSWNGKILVGGPHTSVMRDFPEAVDHVVIGEGEKVITEIVNGASWLDERYVHSKRMTSEELDALPFEPWDTFTALPYDFTCPWMDATPTFTMNTSRGCPFNCSFCSVNSVWGKNYTRFSAERIVDEIWHLVEKFNARGIYFREDNFTIDKKRTEEFCDLLIYDRLDITWACETRVDTLSRKLIEKMSRAGCRAFYLGVESGSQKILNMVNKKIDLTQVENAIKIAKYFGIRSYCSLITGLPGETREDFLKTEKLMEKLKPYHYNYNVFVGIPYSDLYQSVVEKNQHEYIDDIGLIYMPGYDVKAKYFYGMDSNELVDHEFDKNRRSDYDRYLIKRLKTKKFSNAWNAVKGLGRK